MRVLFALLSATGIALAQGSIEGKVIDSTTRAGIGGVGVSVTSLQRPERPYDTTTDTTGTFKLANVAPGRYQARFAVANYDTSEPAKNPPIAVVPNQTTNVTFELHALASLAGRVLDPDGNPVSGAKIYLRNAMGESPGVMESVDDGTFVLKDVRAGTYTLAARPPNAPIQDGRQVVETFFPNAVEPEQASRITLAPGTNVSGQNIRLQRVPVFTIRGTVRDGAGQPVAKVNVYVGKRSAPKSMPGSLGEIHYYQPGAEGLYPDSGELQNAITADNGSFELPGMPEDDWLLQAESEWIRVEGTETDVQQVGFADAVVARRDASDVEIRLAKTFDMRARIELEGNATLAPEQFLNVLLRPDVRGRFNYAMQDGANEVFKQLVPGRYTVSAGAFTGYSGFRLSAAYLGSQNITGQAVEINESSPPMRLVFSKGVGRIEGTLNGANSATIVVVPAAQAADPVIISMDADAGAKFQIPGLAPGQYTIAAFDRIDAASLFAPAILPEIRRLGSTVKIESDAATAVDLRPGRWPGAY